MKVSIASLILFLFLSINSFGQDNVVQKDYNKNTIFVTVGSFGTLGCLNLNYERHILKTNTFILSSLWLRAGGGYWFDWSDNGSQYFISAVGMMGRKNSHLEYGMGITSLYDKLGYKYELLDYNAGYGNGVEPTKWDNTDIKPIFNIGYRYQKPNGHIVFRGGIVSVPVTIYLSLG